MSVCFAVFQTVPRDGMKRGKDLTFVIYLSVCTNQKIIDLLLKLDILFLLICQKEKFLEEKVSKIKISLLIYLFNIIYALYKNSLGTNNSNTVTYILRT